MADLDSLYTALRNADKAGDTDAAQKIAGYIRAQSVAPEATARKTPKQMKIGREGFGEAFGQVLEEATPFARKAAAFGASTRALYEGAKQRLGMDDPEAIRATRMLEAREPGAALAGGVASMVPLSMVPGAGSIAGQVALGAGMGALTPTEGKESVGKNIALSALTGGVGGAAMKGLGMAAKPIIQRGMERAATAAAAKGVRDQTLREGLDLGLTLPRSVYAPSRTTKLLEQVAGKAASKQEGSIRNQTVVNEVAKREASLLPNEQLDEAGLAAARSRLMAPYKEVASMSPEADGLLQQMIRDKSRASAYWREYEGPNHPVRAMDQANKFDAKWKGAEKEIERIAQASEKPDLVQRLRQARVALAKNHDVERAFNVGSGNVEAPILGRMINERGVKGLTGDLGKIARFQQAFKPYMRPGATEEAAPGVSMFRPLVAAGMVAAGIDEGERRYHISPYWMGAASIPLLSGPARRIALSRLMQSAPSYSPGMAAQLTHAATGPLAQRLIPLSAVAARQEQQ